MSYRKKRITDKLFIPSIILLCCLTIFIVTMIIIQQAQQPTIQKNLEAVESQIYDVSNFSPSQVKIEENAEKPSGVKSYAVIRYDYENKTWNMIDSEPSRTEEWTQEQIDGIDYLVFAYPVLKYQSYTNTVGGSDSIASESVELYFYDVSNKTFIKTILLEGAGFPLYKPSSKDLKMSDTDVRIGVNEYLLH